jgi:hypothetical protein
VAHAGTMLSISEAFPDLPAPAKNGRKLQVTSLHK